MHEPNSIRPASSVYLFVRRSVVLHPKYSIVATGKNPHVITM